jgi:hypothetical protein
MFGGEKQSTFGRTKYNLELQVKKILLSIQHILVQCKGVDFKVTGIKFMTVFVM